MALIISFFWPLDWHKWWRLVKTYLILLSFSFVQSKTLFLKCQCMLEYNSIHFFTWANKDSTLATSLWFHQLSSGPGGASTYSLFGRCETSIISSIGRLFNGMKLFFQLLYTKARWRSSSCPPPPPQSPPLHKARHNKAFSHSAILARLPIDGVEYFDLLIAWFTQVVDSCQNMSIPFAFVWSQTLFLKCQQIWK